MPTWASGLGDKITHSATPANAVCVWRPGCPFLEWTRSVEKEVAVHMTGPHSGRDTGQHRVRCVLEVSAGLVPSSV